MRALRIWSVVTLAAVVLASLGGCAPSQEPTEVPAEPTEVPAEPTEVPAEPTEVPAEPTEVPAEPTEVPEEEAGEAKHGGTLTIAIPEEVRGLDNRGDSGTEGEYPLNQITDGLVNADMDRNIVPGLAESWEVSDDGLVYTFHLREGVTFHNGTEFDAEDVKWTMDEAVDPDTYLGSKWAPFIEGTEVVDKYTVEITLKQPWFQFLDLLAFEEDLDILSREAYEEWGDDYGYQAAVGTGPFKFDHWDRGEELVLVRNEDYWGAGEEDLPYLDAIVYRPILEDSAKMMQIATGEVDTIFTVPFTEVDTLRADPNIVIDSTPAGTIHYLGFVCDHPLFDDVKVRQALNYGIDKQAIVDTIFAGHATVAKGIFPPTLFVATEDQYYAYDPERAKEMLAEAGYTAENPLEFLILTSNASLYQEEAVVIQSQLAEIDVQVEIMPLEKAALSEYMFGTAPDPEKRQAELYRYGYTGTFIQDYTYRTFHTDGSLNVFEYSNPEVDQVIEESLAATTREGLLETNHQVNEMIMQDAPWVFIAFQNNVLAMQDYVKDLKNWNLSTMPMDRVWLDQ